MWSSDGGSQWGIESTSSSTSSRSSWSPSWSSSTKVLSIQCIKGTSHADEWSGQLLQSGDIVHQIQIGDLILRAPFKDGNSGLQRHLHFCFKNKLTSIRVSVRRCDSDDSAELNACLVPDTKKKHSYVLRAIHDPNYAVSFVDRPESECFQLQASRASRLQHALNSAQLADGYVTYPWDKKMQDILQVPNSSSFMSILFLPKASDQGHGGPYNDLEDTIARANVWFSAANSSGVPITLNNFQTESLLIKISGETASCTVNTSSLSDLPNLANASLYGFEDYHGVDLGVVRAVRLWYSPIQEYPVEIDIREGDLKLGFVISRTQEGFIFISSVESDEHVPSERSGLSKLFRDAMSESKLLVISRINKQKVVPWIVSSTGAIQCFNTVSICHKLSLHRHAKVPILIHVLMWRRHDGGVPTSSSSPHTQFENQVNYSAGGYHIDSVASSPSILKSRLAGDADGDLSFRLDK